MVRGEGREGGGGGSGVSGKGVKVGRRGWGCEW